MKRQRWGIRRCLLACLTIFVVLVLALLWIFQISLLDYFYRAFRTADIEYAASLIEKNLGHESLDILLEQLSDEYDTCILILDERNHTVATAQQGGYCLIHRMRDRDLNAIRKQTVLQGRATVRMFDVKPQNQQRIPQGQFEGRKQKTRRISTQYLVYAKMIGAENGNQLCLLLNTVITPLDATVFTLQKQLGLITVIVLVLAMLIGIVLSRAFSKPIIETTLAARSLAQSKYTRPESSRSYRQIDELNTSLQLAAKELGQVENLQHELIANVSHDLRTPLTMIGGYAEVMRDIPGENTPENMQMIIDETKRLSSLVNDLLDFSRMQAGITQISTETFDFTQAVRKIVDRCSAMSRQNGYTIVFEAHESVRIEADRGRIDQVLMNLINNAITYTGDDRLVKVTQVIESDRVKLMIRDTGEGISQEELPMIWNRYWRSKQNHRRAVQGSGLGLNIVRTILENHHAEYGVESTRGQGTTFWFKLPIVKEKE